MRLSIPLGGGIRLSLGLWSLLLLAPVALLVAYGLLVGGLIAGCGWLLYLAVRLVVRWWQRYPDMATRLANLPWPPQPS